MEFLNKVFEQRDKPISDSSKKLYTRNLMKLNNEQPITNFNFLKEPKQILNMIKDYHHSNGQKREFTRLFLRVYFSV